MKTFRHRSLVERAQIYLRIRFVGDCVVLVAMLVAQWLHATAVNWTVLALIGIDLGVLVWLRTRIQAAKPTTAIWVSLLLAALLAAVGIHWGGSAATISVGFYVLLILGAALIFLRRAAAQWMLLVVSGCYLGITLLEVLQIFPRSTPLYFLETQWLFVNRLLGLILLVVTTWLVGSAVEILSAWQMDLQAEVERQHTVLQQALENKNTAFKSLRLLSGVNQLIVREHHPQKLFDEICHLIVDSGYTYAWVGKLAQDSNHIEVFAQAGEPIQSLQEPLHQAMCANHAVHTQQCTVMASQANSLCNVCPLHPAIPEHVAASLPIQRDQQIFGVIVAARLGGSLQQSEIGFLKELADDLAYALENLELERQRRALLEASQALIALTTETNLLESALQYTAHIFSAVRAALFLYDESLPIVRAAQTIGLAKPFAEDLGAVLSQVSVADPQPIVVNHFADITGVLQPLRNRFKQERIRACVVFPLVQGRYPLGFLFVAYRLPQVFTRSKLESGLGLANIISVSLQNLRLLAQTRAKSAEQAMLYAAAQEMSMSLLNPPALLTTFAQYLVRALKAASAAIFAFDAAERTFTLLAAFNNDSKHLPEVGRTYSLHQTPHLRAILQSSQVFCISDPHSGDPSLFVPLLSQGTLVGYAEIHACDAQRDFSQSEIHLAQTMASYAANIVHTSRLFTRLEQAYDSTLEGWARALELRDKETEGHTRRVAEMTLRLADAMGLPESQKVNLWRGALLHDIGKIAVPDEILNKPAALTPEEQLLMQQHPVFAYQMLAPIEYLHFALDIPYAHHEKWDGSGYPRGLKGEAIPLAARLFAIVDVYDALRSDRPYRRAWEHARVLAYLAEQAGKHFDPTIVQIFLKQPPEFFSTVVTEDSRSGLTESLGVTAAEPM